MSEFQQVVEEGKTKVVNWVKRVTIGLLVVLVLGGGAYLWISSWTYSEGSRAGYLVKISKKGVVFKTYEGQLNLGGFQADQQSGIVGNIWAFSVLEDEVYSELQNFEGKQVKLFYKQRYKAMPWQGKTSYFVYKVDPVQQD